MVRQLYQKHLVPYEEYRALRPNPLARNEAQGPHKMTAFEKMVAAANGKEDIDVLGAVAALMDAPGQDVHADKRLKAGVAQVTHQLSSTTFVDPYSDLYGREIEIAQPCMMSHGSAASRPKMTSACQLPNK
jgi:hypothetical protein